MCRTSAIALVVGLVAYSGTSHARNRDADPADPKPVPGVGASPSTAETGAPSLAPDLVDEAEADIESAVSSPPMEMDDPGTPGRHGIELNLVESLARVGDGRGSETLLDANYGLGERWQLKFERPYLMEGASGEPTQEGLGATEIGVKWRCVDHDGLEIAMYPQYSFNDGFTLVDEEGNPEPDEGSAVYFPVLISEVVHHVYTLAANFGYRHNLDHPLQDTVAAFGAGRAFGENIRVLSEIYSERDEHFNNRQTDVRIGWVETLFPKTLARSKMEFIAFASFGHSIGQTEEGEPSTSFAFGLSMIKKPRGEY